MAGFAEFRPDIISTHKSKGRRQKKKNGKISDIVQNSNYPLPPCPNNDE